MSDTIRNVVIKTKIEIEGDEALKKIQENAKKWNGELEKTKRNEQAVTNEVKKLTRETDKTRRAQLSLEDALGKVQVAAKRAATEYVKGNASAGKGLDGLIRKEKELLAQIKRRDAAIQRSRAAIAGGQGPGFLGRAGAVAGGVGRVGAVTISAVTAFLSTPALLKAGAEQIGGIRAEFAGGAEAEEKGLFTSAGRAVLKELVLLRKSIREATGSRLFSDIVGGGGAGLAGLAGITEESIAKVEREKERAAAGTLAEQRLRIIQKEVSLAGQLASLVEARYGKELQNQRKIIDKEKDRLRTIQQQAAAEEKQRQRQVGGGLAQFGKEEQRFILESIQRFQKGGAGALTTEELERIQKTGFGRELFESQAQKLVDPGILREIVKIIGETRRQELQQEEKKAQAAILQAQSVVIDVKEGITVGDINIQTSGLEEAFDKANQKLSKLLAEKFELQIRDVEATIRRLEANKQNNFNAIVQ